MSGIDRYERTRSEWLLQHEAAWHLSDRRMANALKRRAAEKDRAGAGAAESSHHEGRIKPIGVRFIARGEDPKETATRAVFLAVVIVPAVAVAAGPALLASQALYAASTEVVLRSGRAPRPWPWAVAAALVAAAGVATRLIARPGGLVDVSMWPSMVIDVDWAQLWTIYLWTQLALGLLLTAWQVRRHGWPGVTIRRTPRTPDMPVVRYEPRTTAAERSENAADEPAKTSEGPRVPALPEPALPADDYPIDAEDEPVFDEDDYIYLADEDDLEAATEGEKK